MSGKVLLHAGAEEKSYILRAAGFPGEKRHFSLNGTIGKITPFLFRQRKHRGGEGPECYTRQASFAWKKCLVEGINAYPFECPQERRRYVSAQVEPK